MNASGIERKRRLRRLGITGTIAAFLAAWAIIFGQLVFGHDPALGKAKTSQSQPANTTSTTPSGGSTSNDATSGDDGGSGLSSPAPATTSQS